MTTAIFCGSRDWTDEERVRDALRWAAEQGVDEIAHGDCRGADRMAADNAALYGMSATAYPADWEEHGKAAGPIRNQQMLDEAHPVLCVAFLLPGSRGTADMVRRAKAAGVRTIVVQGPR